MRPHHLVAIYMRKTKETEKSVYSWSRIQNDPVTK